MEKILLSLIFIFCSYSSFSSHIMGGEITWECIKDPANPDVGKYIFKMKVYRDCAGVTLSAIPQTINAWDNPLNSPFMQITLNWVESNDITPDGNAVNSGNSCLSCTPSNSPLNAGAVEEFIFESNPITLFGSPPVTGWHFTWDNCCRNFAISNLVLSTPYPNEGIINKKLILQ